MTEFHRRALVSGRAAIGIFIAATPIFAHCITCELWKMVAWYIHGNPAFATAA
jgi:hypothetical protein